MRRVAPASTALQQTACRHAVERGPGRRGCDARALHDLEDDARAQRFGVAIEHELTEEGQQQSFGLPAAQRVAASAFLGRVHAHASVRTASPRLARWICSYTCVRNSVKRGSALVVI